VKPTPVTETRPTVVIDLDGTLRDTSEIIHLVTEKPKRYDEFYQACATAPPLSDIVLQIKQQYFNPGWYIVIATGQPEKYRRENQRWIHEHLGQTHFMFTRDDGDHRKAPAVKLQMLTDMWSMGLHPADAWDDDPDVVKMYLMNGIKAHLVPNPSREAR